MNTTDVLKHLVLHAGTGWILWLLAVLSVLALTVIIERWLYLQARSTDLQRLAEQIGRRLDACDYRGAIEDLEGTRVVASRIAAAGLRLSHLGPAAAEKAMESARALEQKKMERGLALLGTLGNNAPFIGLLGTVIGVVHAFEALGHGHAHPGSANKLVEQSVMAGIAEALVATAIGIAVALPAVAFYNYFQRRIAGVLSDSNVLTKLVSAYLVGHRDTGLVSNLVNTHNKSHFPQPTPEKHGEA